jgi:hypothetical protein
MLPLLLDAFEEPALVLQGKLERFAVGYVEP